LELLGWQENSSWLAAAEVRREKERKEKKKKQLSRIKVGLFKITNVKDYHIFIKSIINNKLDSEPIAAATVP